MATVTGGPCSDRPVVIELETAHIVRADRDCFQSVESHSPVSGLWFLQGLSSVVKETKTDSKLSPPKHWL